MNPHTMIQIHNHLSAAAIRVHTKIVTVVAKCACSGCAPLIPPVVGGRNVTIGSLTCGAEEGRDTWVSHHISIHH